MDSSAQPYALYQKIDPIPFPLFVTEDFTRSVGLRKDAKADEYLRPVNCVLTRLYENEMNIISPYEADVLLPKIRASASVRLHMFTPRTNKKKCLCLK